MLNPGDRIGRYTLERILGMGAMGVVYSATDERLKRRVAVKLMKPELAREHKFLERFRREAEMLGMLNHPNIVSMYDLVEDDGYVALIMEYISGEGLDGIIGRMGLIPPGRCLPLFKQIGEAISYAHELGVIHRDLKPANVMVGTDGVAKVMDFGIARLVARETRFTKHGASVGTVGYMSPEVAKGYDATESSDVYSLGVILYEMLTGRLPIDATSHDDLLAYMKAYTVVPPSHHYPYIQPTLEMAVLQAIELEAENRFASVRAFLDSLVGLRISDDGSSLDIRTRVPESTTGAASGSSWGGQQLDHIADRFKYQPHEVVDQLNSGELSIFFRMIGREDLNTELDRMLRVHDQNAFVALAWFLDMDGSRGIRDKRALHVLEEMDELVRSLNTIELSESSIDDVKMQMLDVVERARQYKPHETIISAAMERLAAAVASAEHRMAVNDRDAWIYGVRSDAERFGLECELDSHSSDDEVSEVELRVKEHAERASQRRWFAFGAAGLLVLISIGIASYFGAFDSDKQYQERLFSRGQYERIISKYPSSSSIVKRAQEELAERLYQQSRYDEVLNRYPATTTAVQAKERLADALFNQGKLDELINRYSETSAAIHAREDLATRLNNEGKYQEVLNRFPKTKQAEVARDRICNALFNERKYQELINRFPNSPLVPQARTRLTEFEAAEKARGTLVIQSKPWGQVFVNGSAQGSTPVTLTVRPGTYEVIVRRADFQSCTESATVTKDNTTRVICNL